MKARLTCKALTECCSSSNSEISTSRIIHLKNGEDAKLIVCYALFYTLMSNDPFGKNYH